MADLGTIQSYVSTRLIDPSGTAVSAADVIIGINESIQYWKHRRFWFNEVNDTSTLTAGSADFPYPTDFLMPALKDDGFAVEYGNIRYPLAKVTKQQGDNLYIANAQGLPRWYWRAADQEYQCFPIPNLAYTVQRHYLKEYDDLVTSTETNDFTDHAERLIKLWTLANLTQEIRQDTEQATYFREAAQDEYENLQIMTNKSNASGRLTIHSNI
jgi:hypothetical protein